MIPETPDFGDLLKAYMDALGNFGEHLDILLQCRMRRFVLVRKKDVDPDQISGVGVIAEGVVFEDGRVALRWKTKYKSSVFYDSLEDVEAIHGHNGKTVLSFIDAERPA